MSRTRTENEAPYHKYFTQMLNIAEDELDPFQYRLLAHYVRWTGHGGESDESIRKTAKATKMGVNKVRSTLNELVALKYITVERPTPQEARNGKTIHITILDRWMDNISKYQAVSKKIQDNPQPVSNPIHTPVSNPIRIEEQNTEEPLKTNTQHVKRVERKREPFYDAISTTFKLTASGQIVSIRSMMQGTAKRGTWKDCNFEPPVIDAQEILDFGVYMTKRIDDMRKQGKKIDNISAAVTIQRWFYDFREAQRKASQPMTEKERWATIPELQGITEIIR